MLITSLAGKQDVNSNFNTALPTFTFDFTKSTPTDLITLLKNKDNRRSKSSQIVFMDRAPIDWIKKSDIKFLMTLIYSHDTSKCFISVFSSTSCFNNCYATIGGQAIEMIECYREKSKFPRSFFNCPNTDLQKVKNIRKWWENTEH
jgi:hypothetical protein